MASLHMREGEQGGRGEDKERFIRINKNGDIAKVFEQISKLHDWCHLETSPHLYWCCSCCRNMAKFVSAFELVNDFFFLDRLCSVRSTHRSNTWGEQRLHHFDMQKTTNFMYICRELILLSLKPFVRFPVTLQKLWIMASVCFFPFSFPSCKMSGTNILI